MSKLDIYMLTRLTVTFCVFTLILTAIYWINRAVSLFDFLLSNGHSLAVFLELSALSLPNVIRLIMPLSSFIAALYVTQRLANDNEITAIQAGGAGPFRMARPVFYFAALGGTIMLLFTHLLVPMSVGRSAERMAQIRENVTSRLIVAGTFFHPVKGLTLFTNEIDADGQFHGVYVKDTRTDGAHVTYTASRALFLRTQQGPLLMMFEGMAQRLSDDGRRLDVSRFDEFVFDLTGIVSVSNAARPSLSALPTATLLAAEPKMVERTGQTAAAMRVKGHERFAQALLCAATAIIGFAVLQLGRYSRFGLWRQIQAAVACLVAIKILESGLFNLARSDLRLWPLSYLAALIAFVVGIAVLAFIARPRGARKPKMARA